VSANNPLRILINGVANSVTGFTADNPGDETGPGVLTVTSVSVADRDPVISLDRSYLVRVGAGSTVDALSSSNILRLQDIQSAVARFRQQNVPEMPDGRYHAHLDPSSEAQLFRDPEWQSLNRSLPDYYMYKSMAVGEVLGTVFARNSEAPIAETVEPGTQTGFVTPTSSFSLDDPFAGELYNHSGVKVHRVLFAGQGGIYEYYQDLGALITDAGITGKVGEPRITNNGIEVMCERIQLILRAPLNRLQDSVSASWKFIGDWPVRTDAASGDAARFKRFLTIEHGE
jgi:hypothetical protein